LQDQSDWDLRWSADGALLIPRTCFHADLFDFDISEVALIREPEHESTQRLKRVQQYVQDG
jgi:hypothetical protein